MNKLSRREKILLYVLGCFLIGIFGLYFVIKPSYERFLVVSAQAVEAQFTQQTMEIAIVGIPTTMQARDDAKTKLAELKTPFSPKLPNEGVDSLLTQLCLGYSLAPRILAIESNEVQSVQTFTEYYSENGASASVGGADTTTETNGTKDTTGTTDAAGTPETTPATTETTDNVDNTGGVPTQTSVVSMELTGTQANFYRLLDGVAARPDMIISNFGIKPVVSPDAISTTNGTTTTNVVYSGFVPKLDGGNIKINVTFTVYMVEK